MGIAHAGAIKRKFKISNYTMLDINAHFNKTLKKRKEEIAERLEGLTIRTMNSIKDSDFNCKLSTKASAIDLFVKNMQLLRGQNTDNVGVDFSKMSEKDVLEYLDSKDKR